MQGGGGGYHRRCRHQPHYRCRAGQRHRHGRQRIRCEGRFPRYWIHCQGFPFLRLGCHQLHGPRECAGLPCHRIAGPRHVFSPCTRHTRLVFRQTHQLWGCGLPRRCRQTHLQHGCPRHQEARSTENRTLPERYLVDARGHRQRERGGGDPAEELHAFRAGVGIPVRLPAQDLLLQFACRGHQVDQGHHQQSRAERPGGDIRHQLGYGTQRHDVDIP